MSRCKMQHWLIRLSYLGPDVHKVGPGKVRRWRENAEVGVVAPTIQYAIEEAIEKGVPEGGEEVKVWSASHRGRVDAIVGVD